MIVTRPDLTERVALSKSAVVGWDLCPTKAGYELTERRPLLPNEKITFGSALDAACEALIVAHREGWPEDKAFRAAFDAVDYISKRDEIELDAAEVTRAVKGFRADVLTIRAFPWAEAELQPELNAEIAGLGPVNGHPDVIFPAGPWDIKTSRYKKDLPSVELGLYAILLEEARGIEVTEAGYLTWVRSGKGRWEVQPWPITSEARRWAWARVNQYARVREAGAFFGAPKFPGLCADCAYNPANGGPCEIAWGGTTE